MRTYLAHRSGYDVWYKNIDLCKIVFHLHFLSSVFKSLMRLSDSPLISKSRSAIIVSEASSHSIKNNLYFLLIEK